MKYLLVLLTFLIPLAIIADDDILPEPEQEVESEESFLPKVQEVKNALNNLSMVAATGVSDTTGEFVGIAYTASLPEIYGIKIIVVEPVLGYFSKETLSGNNVTYFGALGIGARFKFESGFYVKGTAAPAYISEKDDRLGSNFQFILGASTGFQTSDIYVGLVYRHISNANITKLNSGRDFVGIESGLQF